VVLNRHFALVALAVAFSGCIKRVPPQHLPERTPMAAVLVVDPESKGSVEEAPDALAERLKESLESRNVVLERAPLSALGGQMISNERAKALARSTPQSFKLLVETRAIFFSQLDGRFRWTVAVRVTATRASDGASSMEEFTLPAALQFDHQKGAAAVEAVSDEIARRAALVVDTVIAAPTTAPAPANPDAVWRPKSIYFVMVDRFANGDRSNDADVDLADAQAFHGGDLAGVTQRLDWL
jgi:hypothetical protein